MMVVVVVVVVVVAVCIIIRTRNSLFGHVARLGKDTPAHQALQRQIDVSFGRLSDDT